MNTHVTLVRPRTPRPDGAATPGSYALPADLLDQVRSRVGLLALLLFFAFSLDPVLHYGFLSWSTLFGTPLPSEFSDNGKFQWIEIAGALSSAAMWWIARGKRVPPARLLSIGLVYEIVVCFITSYPTFWMYYREHGILPNLTWVPVVVIMFPLILPGPPRRMLGAAIVSGAMQPLALALLQAQGYIVASGEDYARIIVSSTFAVVFASAGARIVYRLGREVVTARELGSYRLEALLGQGGMGEVWRAKHRMLARPAAIKLIRRDAGGQPSPNGGRAAVQRFEREAQVIAGLRSPHTVELFDFGTAADGTIYYVMELLEGFDAHALVTRFGPLPAERAIHLLRQMCHSLSEAHARGVVHRDIKPANVFLCRYGEEVDFVKVLDFGLAKETVPRPAAETALTAEQSIAGTPAFLAPEQALGREPLDGRVDIYATGCVAYWLLTGELVFPADSPIELIVKHANETPAPPSTRTELPIPPALDRLILSCLAKDPAERPQTARALADALAAVEGADDWTEARSREWWGRHAPSPA